MKRIFKERKGEKEQEIFILKESKKREIFNCVPFV
jgi:hypothetical protein